MICVSLTEKNTERALWGLRQAAEVADLVELRLDYMEEYDLPRLIEARPCPVIVTNRPTREGGKFEGDETDRVRPLHQAISLGADYVDREHDAVPLMGDRRETKLIVSYHNFEETPKELMRVHGELEQCGADIVKVAVWANEISDNLIVFDVLQRAEIPTIAICMGEPGLISRVLAPKFGAFLTFTTLGSGPASGPGQLLARTMREVYRADRMDRDTAVYGLVSPCAGDSPSIAAFNDAFRASGVNAVYVPFQVAQSPEQFLHAFRSLDVQGYTVAVPHQEAILAALDGLDPSATKKQAVDTVVVHDGKLLGYFIGAQDPADLMRAQIELWMD